MSFTENQLYWDFLSHKSVITTHIFWQKNGEKGAQFYGGKKGGTKHSKELTQAWHDANWAVTYRLHTQSLSRWTKTEDTFQTALVHFENMSTKANIYTILTEINHFFTSPQEHVKYTDHSD